MFSYDPVLCTVVKTLPKSIGDAVRILQEIQAICVDGDGLKWFNWLYLKVTQAVEEHVASGGFKDPAWLASSTCDLPLCTSAPWSERSCVRGHRIVGGS